MSATYTPPPWDLFMRWSGYRARTGDRYRFDIHHAQSATDPCYALIIHTDDLPGGDLVATRHRWEPLRDAARRWADGGDLLPIDD